ncbi:GntR family transcriptional regulator [Luteococcus peritonei]|uniref:GntR family transcriptional regulator n=1 Tax=Luteococcus peritonei TaxID=88874 RepID=A0ABW4RUF0_9ACTN
MLWQVDPGSSQPLFEQLAAQVRHGVASGQLVTGERLPSAKELAASLEVNLHTVLRAYQQLRDEGLIELRRGRGAVVIADDPGLVQLEHLADQLLQQARRLGLSIEQTVGILESRK